MKELKDVDEKGIKISERLRGNVYPDSKQKLNEDIIAAPEVDQNDALIVDSDHPESEEWPTRENTQEKDAHH